MATETTRQRTGATGTDLSVDSAAALAEEEHGPIQGRSPWYLAWRRLRRNWMALAFLVLFFSIVWGLINAFQIFDSPYILTSGGPGDASRTVVMYIYETGFRFFQMGYASTIALSLFLIVVVLTLIQFRLSRIWVFYQ